MNLKVYFINLDGSTERRQALEANLAATGLPFERVAGVRGNALPDDLTPYFLDADGNPPTHMTPGEIGCFAAHRACVGGFWPILPIRRSQSCWKTTPRSRPALRTVSRP